MRKTDKKIENNLRQVLTKICESSLKEINGFKWLTHFVNYDNFPKSLQVVCIFDNNVNLATFMVSEHHKALSSLIQEQLLKIDIKINNIQFDSEENGAKSLLNKSAERLH